MIDHEGISQLSEMPSKIRKNPHFSQVFHAVFVALGEMQADLYRFDFEAI